MILRPSVTCVEAAGLPLTSSRRKHLSCSRYANRGNSGGVVYESNPLASMILMNYGWAGMVLFKFADMVAVSWIILVLCLFRPKIGRRILFLACGIVAAVILYSSCLAFIYTT